MVSPWPADEAISMARKVEEGVVMRPLRHRIGKHDCGPMIGRNEEPWFGTHSAHPNLSASPPMLFMSALTHRSLITTS